MINTSNISLIDVATVFVMFVGLVSFFIGFKEGDDE